MVTLNELLNRMNFWQVIKNTDEVKKVQSIDDAIRTEVRELDTPWTGKKSTLRVFQDVITYPAPSDYKELWYVDTSTSQVNVTFDRKARFRFTSMSEFFENIDSRNQLAEVWNNGVISLGVRYRDQNFGSSTLTTAESDVFTIAGDVVAKAIDYVTFISGSASLRLNVVLSTNSFSVSNPITFSFTNTTYKKNYYFRWFNFNSAPTNVELRVGKDALNYLTGTVTTQFDGSPFIANNWNLLAIDLNTATEVGSVNNTFSYEESIVTGVTSGFYYIDASYFRQWTSLDYWYYSQNNIVKNDGTEQPYFMLNSVYSGDSLLKGDDVWSDIVLYKAALSVINEKENKNVYDEVNKHYERAWKKMNERYPDEAPLINTTRYRFSGTYELRPSFNDFN